MTSPTGRPGNILIVDAGHGIGPALTALLSQAGFDTGNPTFENADAVIFNMSALDETALLASGELADALESETAFFLQTLQAVSRAMIERGHGQIWVLAPDDSFSYYLPLPAAPIAHHTRIGAMRALAKEVARFGVFANAAILQPVAEMADPAAWNAARAGIGSYAQKFRPMPLATVAETLGFWLSRPTLPMNGSVVHFGNGVYDGNF